MPAAGKWDTGYERKAVAVLGIGFGLVFLDRLIIAPLFPFMMNDLHLGYQDLGNLFGILGICWGVFAVVMGGVSDRIGHRKILIPAMILFSLLSGLSGAATGFAGLLIIRAVMGFTEGSFCPPCFAANADASEPKRRGFNLGVQQSAAPLLGSALGPIIATQLLRVVPSWRWVFFTVSIPGLILAFFMYRIIREPYHLTGAEAGDGSLPRRNWFGIFHSRNLRLATLALLCAMTGLFVLSSMLPNYFVDFLHLSGEQMGFIMSAMGFGGFLGQIALPGLSDILGRKIVAVLGFLGAAVSLYFFTRIGANPPLLFAVLFLPAFFCMGSLGLLTGPIAVESAPAGMVSSAVGIVVGAGEIFGGGIAPASAGYIAQHYGIEHTLDLALWASGAAVLACLFLKETAPRKMRLGAEGGLTPESRAGFVESTEESASV